VDRERFAERLEASSKDLSKARAKLECAKQKLDVRERHIKDIVIQASVMKKVMEQTMQGYRDATRNLAELKDSQMANPANRPPFLSMRNRKLHNDFRAQKREVEKELSMTLQNLRSTEKKWKEAQALLNACTRDVDKQKCVVRDAAEDLRQAEAERSSVKEMLRKAEHELHSTREQLEDVRAPASSQNKPIALRRARTFDELAVANEKARRLEKRLSQVEAECEDTRSKLKTMKKRASLSPDTHLQKQLLIARRELKDREELLGMVKATNTELAEKIAQMELQLSGQITT
jgi:DNA repair exonuclease SbcCD ATPase subunit